jgi:peptidoglycan/LPS O-acetylase OafA/YrhL
VTLPRAFDWPSHGRIPSLDGLRAISIALVFVAHTAGTGIATPKRIADVAADVGVRTFFVLSGFLITTLLIREQTTRGTISLRDFYIRRTLRIFPAFYAYTLVVAALAVTGVIALLPGDLAAACTYSMNFHAARSWWTGHLWSLAVEEQFYVVWPLILFVLGATRSWRVAFAAILIAPVARIALWRLLPGQRDLADQAFPCVFDALATGCLLALAMRSLARSETCARLLDGRWMWLAAPLGLAPLAITNPWIHYSVSMTIANVTIALILLRCVTRPPRWLEHPALRWIGTLSYSLYLWQQLFLNRHSDGWAQQFPVNVALALAAAVVCHYVIERPFLRLSGGRTR